MNRTILTLGGVLSASSLLLMDSAIKGTVLLSLAAVLALMLRRDSAATRHLVWMMAIVAMLFVPVLSATLPQWRVLPNWMSSPRSTVAAIESVSPPALPMSAVEVIELPQRATSIAPMEVDSSAAPDLQPAAQSQVLQPTMMAPREIPAQVAGTWSWISAIPLVWAIGSIFLMLRLSAARWMLWNSERLAIVIGRQEASQSDPIVIAMTALCSKLKIRRPITLLIHPHKTIPVVWGIFRCRLMLPVAARQWSDEQLQSVLMHELAHIKRGDTLVQLLTQLACALHWFNPLVWFAAWRLDVERERSCDDLVLASGIRPSAYAAHLLDVVSGFSPARWTQACGLAMARKSSLEGRLTAVLGKDLNRRSVSVTLAGLALFIAVGLVVPIAMLRAGDEEWNPPSAAHVGSNDFSCFCVQDGKESAYIVAYHGDFGSSSSGSSNAKSRTWNDDVKLMLLDTVDKREFTLRRDHRAPNKLTLDRKDYDLGKGRVFLLDANGSVRQLDIATPPVTAREGADDIAKLIAKTTPSPMKNRTGKLQPQTIEKLKWGEPVNGLRMALAFPPALNDPLLGEQEFYQLVVQNVSEKAVRYTAGDNAPNPRSMIYREGKRIVQVLSDKDAQRADWNLAPGECGVLWLFTKEERNKDGKTVSSLLDNDLPSDTRYHVVVSMEITQAPEGAWTGKLVTGELRGSEAVAAPPTPIHNDARALYEVWQRYTRSNGDIPGALVGELAAAVKQFIKYNPTWETVPKLNDLLPRLDATRDWKPADAIAILDEVAAIQGTPLSMAFDNDIDYVVRTGKPLPKELAEAQGVWGPADEDGLRVVWDLQPRRDLEVLWAKHASVSSTAAIGEALKARILVHNSGEKPIVVRVPTFLQCEVKADDQERKAVECQGIHWTRESRLYTCRLAPGEYVVIDTPGVGFGKEAGRGPWAGPRVGWNVMAQPGDSVTLKHASVPFDGSQSGRREDAPFAEGPDWWPAFIKTRLGRELPLPNDATERARILDRAANELFGSAPTADEREAFAKVAEENSLSVFIAQLAQRPGLVSFFGKLQPEVTSFKIVAADANADKQPRVVLGPGEYPLPSTTATRGQATLKIVGKPVGDRRINDAQLLFEPVEFTGARPPDPHKIEVPDGWGTWAIVCCPTDGYFYLLHNGTVRKIDYSKPRSITDTPANDLPAEFRDEVKRQLDIAGVSAAQQAEVFEKPAAPAKLGHTQKDPLLRTVSLVAEKMPLRTVMERLASDADLKIEFDVEALERVELDLQEPVTVRLENVSLQRALDRVINWEDHFGAMREVRGDKLVLTTLEVWQNRIAERLPEWMKPLYNHGLLATLDDNNNVVTVTTSGIVTDELLAKIATLPKLKELHIEVTNGITTAGLAHLGKMAHLEKLSLHSVNSEGLALGDEAIRSVVGLESLRDLSVSESGVTDAGAKWVEQMPQLTSLALYQEGRLTDEALKSIGSLSNLESLSLNSYVGTARLGWMRFSAEGIRQLKDLKGLKALHIVGQEVTADALDFPQLTSLSLGHASVDDAVVTKIGEFRSLQYLELTYCQFGNNGLKVIASLPKLQRLTISGGTITDAGIEHIRSNKTLEHITLRVSGLSDLTLEHLSQIKTLTRLDLYGSGEPGVVPGRNFGMAGLRQLKQLPNLETLWLTNFDQSGGYAGLKELRQLQELTMMMCNISNIELESLQEALPNTRISHMTGGSGYWTPKNRNRAKDVALVNEELEFTMPEAAEPATVEPKSGASAPKTIETEKPKPNPGAMLKPATEQKLKWGEPVNGLRMALAWPPVLGEPELGDKPVFYLVVQNVSEKGVRLTSKDTAPNPRRLNLYDATIVSRHVDGVTIPGDWLLQPREAAFIRLFHSEQKFEDGRTTSILKENIVSNLGQYSFTAEMTIEKAPAGAWTGKLVTGATRGSADTSEGATVVEAPKKNMESRKPSAPATPALNPQGTKLLPAIEQKLKWGEPVNGLRAALVMHPVPDEPDAQDKNDIFMVVQNVTKAEVWLHASDAAPNPRQLIWRDKGVLETVTEVAKPIAADIRLQPGDIAFFRMTHPPGKRNPGGRSTGSQIEESIRKDPTLSLEGSMAISTAPNGAWSGKLVTGRTEGGAAIPAL